jgi:hypothetical protein
MSVVCGTPRCAFECLSWRGALTLFGVFVTPPTNERHICLLQPCTGPRGTVHSNWPATGWQGRGVFTWLLIVLLKLCLVSRAVRRHYRVNRLLAQHCFAQYCRARACVRLVQRARHACGLSYPGPVLTTDRAAGVSGSCAHPGHMHPSGTRSDEHAALLLLHCSTVPDDVCSGRRAVIPPRASLLAALCTPSLRRWTEIMNESTHGTHGTAQREQAAGGAGSNGRHYQHALTGHRSVALS